MTLEIMHESCMVVHHPRWATRRVSLICGPPGSGKSTLAFKLHARSLELESIAADDYRVRLKLFGRNAYRVGRARSPDVGVVRGAPGVVEREHHEQLCHPARTIVLLTPADVCHKRVARRDRLTAAGEHEEIDRWWSVWRSENPPPGPTSTTW